MKKLIPFFTLLVMTSTAVSQEYEWWPGGTYDENVPTPKSVFGYEIGTYLTDHLQMVDYIHRLEKSSDRVRIMKYGQSVERRDMYILIISSPANLEKLEEIRQSIQKLADPRITDSQEANRIIESIPPIAWLNNGTDGGETAAFEVGLQMAYQLAAGTDEFTQKILDRLVIILNAVANPDSHQSFVAWMKAATIGPEGTADPNAMEHHVPWHISSDGNHYLVDFNRDAFALTQQEPRAVAKILHHWKPQIWIDNHGEPNEYYFAPFCTPLNRNYPEELRKWATEIGKSCARYFDQMGWSYAKEEVYDLFYPGYWDSYPAFNGAVSATFETNGGGWKHLSWEKPDGSISTLRHAIHGHFMTNMASLEVLAENRRPILQYFRDFYETGMEEVDSEKVKGYVLLPNPDKKRLHDLVALLMRHEIEVHEVNRAFTIDSGRSFTEESTGPMEVPVGSFLVPLKQPKKRLAKALMEADPEIESQFLEEVEKLREMNRKLGDGTPKERLGFYDVTSWSLPLIFGLDAVEIQSAVSLDNTSKLEEPPLSGGQIDQRAQYGYLFSGRSDSGLALAGRLLQEGYPVAAATSAFENSGREYLPGDYLVRVERSPETLHQRISQLAAETGIEVWSTDTAWSDRGVSLGSRRFVDLKVPKILVFADNPTRAVAFGSVYSILEQRFGLKFTAVRAEYFNEIDLAEYNVIVLPDGSAGGYRQILGESGNQKLLQWIEDGGVAIGLKEGARYFTLLKEDSIDTKFVSEFQPDESEELQSIEMHPGSIFKTIVNSDYYLGYGYSEMIPVQVRGNRLLEPTKSGVNVVSFPAGSHLGGHQWEYTEKILEGKSYLVDIPYGEGHVILFAEDPTFRAYWRGLDKLFMNGIILAPSF